MGNGGNPNPIPSHPIPSHHQQPIGRNGKNRKTGVHLQFKVVDHSFFTATAAAAAAAAAAACGGGSASMT